MEHLDPRRDRAHWIAHRLSRGGGLKYPYPAAGHGTRCPFSAAAAAAPPPVHLHVLRVIPPLPLSIGAGPTVIVQQGGVVDPAVGDEPQRSLVAMTHHLAARQRRALPSLLARITRDSPSRRGASSSASRRLWRPHPVRCGPAAAAVAMSTAAATSPGAPCGTITARCLEVSVRYPRGAAARRAVRGRRTRRRSADTHRTGNSLFVQRLRRRRRLSRAHPRRRRREEDVVVAVGESGRRGALPRRRFRLDPIGSFIASWAPRVAGTAAATSPRARSRSASRRVRSTPAVRASRPRVLPGSPSSATAWGSSMATATCASAASARASSGSAAVAPPRRAAAVRTGRGRPAARKLDTARPRRSGGQPRSPNPSDEAPWPNEASPRRATPRRRRSSPGRRGRRGWDSPPRLSRGLNDRERARAAPHRGCASPTGLAADTRRRTRRFPLGHAPGRSSRCRAAKLLLALVFSEGAYSFRERNYPKLAELRHHLRALLALIVVQRILCMRDG